MQAPPRSKRLGWQKRMPRYVNVSTEPGQVQAWGLLFHVEADPTLVRRWLGEPAMRAEAEALDPDLPERIVTEAPRYEGRLAHLQEAVLDALLGPAVLGRRSSHNRTGRRGRR